MQPKNIKKSANEVLFKYQIHSRCGAIIQVANYIVATSDAEFCTGNDNSVQIKTNLTSKIWPGKNYVLLEALENKLYNNSKRSQLNLTTQSFNSNLPFITSNSNILFTITSTGKSTI